MISSTFCCLCFQDFHLLSMVLCESLACPHALPIDKTEESVLWAGDVLLLALGSSFTGKHWDRHSLPRTYRGIAGKMALLGQNLTSFKVKSGTGGRERITEGPSSFHSPWIPFFISQRRTQDSWTDGLFQCTYHLPHEMNDGGHGSSSVVVWERPRDVMLTPEQRNMGEPTFILPFECFILLD